MITTTDSGQQTAIPSSVVRRPTTMIYKKPAWWKLFLVLALLFGALVGMTRLGIPRVVEQIMQFGFIVLAFGTMLVWTRANEGNIEWYELDQEKLRAARRARQIQRDTPPMRSHELPKGIEREMLPPMTGFGTKRERRAVFYVQEDDEMRCIVVEPEVMQEQED